jgi:hypothetical protein
VPSKLTTWFNQEKLGLTKKNLVKPSKTTWFNHLPLAARSLDYLDN